MPTAPPHYRIGELAHEFGVTLRTIRFYEEHGMLTPTRAGRQRIYSVRDRVRLKLILRGKRLGLPLGEIAEIINLYDHAGDEMGQAQKLLAALSARRDQLVQQRDDIEHILAEIDVLEQHCRVLITPSTE